MLFLKVDFLWNLIWILPLCAVLFLIAAKLRKRRFGAIFRDPADADRWSSLSKSARLTRQILFTLSLLFLVIGAARLAWGREVQKSSASGRDILFVFDVSRSMLADDVKPTRLEHAKWLVRELVRQNPGDRFGLISFAGTSFLECPLTADQTGFIQLTDSLDTQTIPLGGTNIQDALETAVKAFEGAEGDHKAVILVSDGDELTGRSAAVVDSLAQHHIPIFAAGIGDPANPSVIRVPDENGGLRILTDENGNAVKSPLNETQLTELTRKTGGLYVRSTVSDPGIDEIERRIRALDRKAAETDSEAFRPIERPGYSLAAALICLCAALCISERKRVRGASVVLIGSILFLSVFPVPVRAQDGTKPPDAVLKAPVEPEVPQKKQPPAAMSPEDLYNQGVLVQTETKDPEQARQFYERAIAAAGEDSEVRKRSFQNLGVVSHRKADADWAAANADVTSQKLDEAEKKLDQASTELDTAESLYRNAFLCGPAPGAAKNQKKLLARRNEIQELKKKIEELRKLQQQAQQQAKDARDQQKKENQQKQDSSQQQKENQQKQDSSQQKKENQQKQDSSQQKKENQQKQDPSQQQKNDSSAERKNQQAKDSAEQLEKKASELKQRDLQKSAELARKELEQAQQSRKNGQGNEAEKHLDNAVKALSGEEKKNEGKKDEDRKSGKQDEGRNKEEKPQDGGDPQNGNTGMAPKPQQEKLPDGKMTKKQAEALLEDMDRKEQSLRDAIKAQRMRMAPKNPGKDW